MFASHFVLGIALIAFGLWLQSTESKGWPNESCEGNLDRQYFARRHRLRRRVNGILIVCGMLILVAGISPPRMFILAWTLVSLALLIVVMLAGLDAVRTQRYHARKLPEIRRDTLGGDE